AAGRGGAARLASVTGGRGRVAARGAATGLVGGEGGPAAIRAAAQAAAEELDPPEDIHASPGYRRQLARVLTDRALRRAWERAAG
ncbi:MAG: xanthine dehydrogenase family protein subunit M, partial [Gemmatimonadota bacterium]